MVAAYPGISAAGADRDRGNLRPLACRPFAVTFIEALAGFLIASAAGLRHRHSVRAVSHPRRRPVSDRHRGEDDADRGDRAAVGDLARHRLVVEDRRGDPDLLLPGAGEYRQRPESRRSRVPRAVRDDGREPGAGIPQAARALLPALSVLGAENLLVAGCCRRHRRRIRRRHARGLAISSSSPRRISKPRRCSRRSSPRRLPASPCSTRSALPSAD